MHSGCCLYILEVVQVTIGAMWLLSIYFGSCAVDIRYEVAVVHIYILEVRLKCSPASDVTCPAVEPTSQRLRKSERDLQQ